MKCSTWGILEECTFTVLLLLANGVYFTIGEDPVSLNVSIRARILTTLLSETTHNQNAQHIDGETFSAGINCHRIANFDTVAVVLTSVMILNIQISFSFLVIMLTYVRERHWNILIHLISVGLKDAWPFLGQDILFQAEVRQVYGVLRR